MVITDKDLRIWLVSGSRTARYPVYGWQSLTIEGDKFGTGRATIAFGKGRPAYAALVGAGGPGFEFFEASIDAFLWDFTTPLFSGPTVNPRLAHQGSLATSSASLTMESFLTHGLRSRLLFSASNATNSTTGKVDDVVLTQIRAGVTGAVSPTGYPGGVSRTDYHSFNYAVASNHSAHPTTITFNEQAGNNTVDTVIRLSEQYDLCPKLAETTAANWQYDVAYPYQRNNQSSAVVLTPYRGTMTAFELDVDYTSMATVWMMAGQGKGATQVYRFTSDATAVANRGVIEDRMTSPDGDATNAVPMDAAYLLKLRKDPILAYKLAVRQNARHRFNLDYGVRDLVGIADPFFERSTAQLVIGYRIQVDAGGPLRLELLIQAAPRNALREMADMTGLPGGRSSGSRWKEKASV